MAGDSCLGAILKWLGIRGDDGDGGTPTAEVIPNEMDRKVLVLNFLPDAAAAQGWFKTDDLIQQYIAKMKELSNGMLVYQKSSEQTIQAYPTLEGPNQYTDDIYIKVMNKEMAPYSKPGSNPPALANIVYPSLIKDYGLVQVIQSGQADEVWLFGGPGFGFNESVMAGRGAFPCNGPSLEYDAPRFVIMGFNYQVEMKNMAHDYGHRMEFILSKKFDSDFITRFYPKQLPDDAPWPPAAQIPAPQNDWEQFILDHGTIHRKPDGAVYSQDVYDWISAIPREWWPATIDPNRV